MKTSVSLSDFHDAFIRMDRKENFSWEGRELLFNYLEELEADTGEEIEFDVIALCCEFYENDWETIAADYSIEFDDDMEEEDKIETVREYLQENTCLVGEVGEGSFIYQAF